MTRQLILHHSVWHANLGRIAEPASPFGQLTIALPSRQA